MNPGKRIVALCRSNSSHWCPAFTSQLVSRGSTALVTKRHYNDFHEPFHPVPGRSPQWLSAVDAVAQVKSGSNIFVQGVAVTPTVLLDALAHHAKDSDLTDIHLYHIHLEGPVEWVKPEYENRIRSICMFIGGNMRKAVNDGLADSMSIFLSETPLMFRRRIVDLDYAFIQVSPPDPKGFCSLGTSIDCTRAAVQNASHIIALANPNVPRTFGDAIIHQSHIDTMVYGDYPLYTLNPKQLTESEMAIGKLIAENLVEDGATLQMGIGSIPDAVLALLKNHSDLGVHTEMFSDGVLDLVKCAAITNALKTVHPGKLVSSFLLGSKKLYDFVDDNPSVFMGDVSWVNDTSVIKTNPKVTAINSCIEVDLTGQIVADSIGTKMFSGVGGQMDYIRGAALSHDGKGKAIMALNSVTKNNESKIVPFIKQGAGVVTTRAHARYVVTEYGIAHLFGKSLRQRAYELINVAHPDHRETLEKAAFDRFKCMPSQK